MTTISRTQLMLLAEAAEVLTKLRESAVNRGTPKPPRRIDIMPGVLDLVVTRDQALGIGFYVLETVQPSTDDDAKPEPGQAR